MSIRLGFGRRLGKQRLTPVNLIERLEERIVFGYYGYEAPVPPPMWPNGCDEDGPMAGGGGVGGGGPSGFGGPGEFGGKFGPFGGVGMVAAAVTAAPVRNFDGQPMVSAADLTSSGFGSTWGHTRTWTGMNDASLNGNGWSVAGVPFVIVAGGATGTSSATGTAHPDNPTSGTLSAANALDQRLQVFGGGGGSFTFDVDVPTNYQSGTYTSYPEWGAFQNMLTWDKTNRLLRLTDAQGNITEFHDVRRAFDTEVESKTLGTGELTSSGLVATVAWSGHKYGVGDRVQVTGASDMAYNGSFSITAVTSTSFSFRLEDAPSASPATGTIQVNNLDPYAKIRTSDPDRPVPYPRSNNLPKLYGQLKRFISANGVTRIQTSYENGYLKSVTRLDVGSTGPRERYVYDYTGDTGFAALTNDLVDEEGDTPPKLIARVTLQRSESGSADPEVERTDWATVRLVDYTYYTGLVPDGSDPGTEADNDPHGRLGDLKLAEVKDASENVIDVSYYRYEKLTGEGHEEGFSFGPTNQHATTGGPDPVDPAFGYDPNNPDIYNIFVRSGLKSVTTGASFSRLAAAFSSYQSESDATIQPYVNNYFEYQRWADHIGEYGGDNAKWRMGYRFGSQYRVTKEVAQGEGCSTCTGGMGTFTLEYFSNDWDSSSTYGYQTLEYNVWKMRTTEIFPDSTTTDDTDNDRSIAYTNELGLPMLQILVDRNGTGNTTDDDKVYATAYRYDEQGRLILKAHPSAVAPYDPADPWSFEGNADLLGFNGSTYLNLNDSTGLIETTAYFKSTTATESTPGGVAGYLWYTAVRRGEQGSQKSVTNLVHTSGTATATVNAHGYSIGDIVEIRGADTASDLYNGSFVVTAVTTNTFSFVVSTSAPTTAGGSAIKAEKVVPTGKQEYIVRRGAGLDGTLSTADDTFAHPLARSTVYRNGHDPAEPHTDTDNAQVTQYSYSWVGNTTQMESVTVQYPTVTTAQNGPNAAASEVSFFDIHGRETWHKDADGFITRTKYDVDTGAVIERIVDVNTATTTDEPSGWSTPAGGGLHLVTTREVDALGRVIREQAPNGHGTSDDYVTYTVYNDAAHEVRIYRGWQGGATDTTTGPIEVMREYRAGTPDSDGDGRVYFEVLTTSATPTDANSDNEPDGTETISVSNIQSLTRRLTNNAGQVVKTDQYYSMTGITSYDQADVDLGDDTNDSSSGNRHRTLTDYDGRGRLKRLASPTETVTRTLYDARGLVTGTWVGTDDEDDNLGDGETFWSPATAGNAEFNLVKVSENEYDLNGNLTKAIELPDGQPDFVGGSANGSSTTPDRVTLFYYDWRDRRTLTKYGAKLNSGGGNDTAGEAAADMQRQIEYCEYDNLGRKTGCEWYDGDGVAVGSYTAGVPDKPSSSHRRARTETAFDEQGRVYQTRAVSVDQSTGGLGNALVTDIWYDARGNVIRSKVPTGLVSKSQYDGAGRVTKSFATDGGGDSGYGDADDVSGDSVLDQVNYTYDANGNVILTATKQRFHDETATGELGDASTSPKARVTYAASYYDSADRLVAMANVGTNGGTLDSSSSGADLDADNNGLPDRPSGVPGRSDVVLVDSYEYDTAGRLWKATDPRGIVELTAYDLLGRTFTAVENYTNNPPSDAADRTTRYTYDGNSNVRTLTADLPSGQNDQTTEYVYGVSPGYSSEIHSNDLLRDVVYPDDGTANIDTERYAYNALGDVIATTDRNQTMHAYTYDVLGRPLSDAVPSLGSGVDGTVRRLETAYDTAGRPYLFTSYDAQTAGNVVNQVQREFNGLGQMTAEYQEHAGAVNTGTSAKVQHAYDTTNSSGVLTKGSRQTSMTYPNGRVLTYNYNGSTLDDAVSRLTSLSDTSATLESYSYLGLSTIAQRLHPQSGVDLTYVKLPTESNGDAGDQYAGLDRFGRVVDQRWLNDNDTPGTPGDDTHGDRFGYGYDRNGNRLWRSNGLHAASGEIYHDNSGDFANGYDGLDRLKAFARGTLYFASEGAWLDGAAQREQSWSLDALGNWDSVATDGATPQTRTHNDQNQVTAVSGATSPVFDDAGNMTTDQTGKQFVYDAWNRSAKAKTSGGTDLVTYAVDALGRRVVSTPAGGTARHDYHSAQWQVLEERESGAAKTQYVWSPAYVDAMVARDTLGGGSATAAGSLDTGFSGDGKLVASLTAGADIAKAIVQADGKVVAVGDANGNVGLARANDDGTLDTTFDGPGGTGNGVFTVDFGGTDLGRSIAVQSDGKIVICGESGGNVILARFNASDGSLDTTFDTDGKVTFDAGGTDGAYDLAIQSDGKIVVVGKSGTNMLVARFNSNGSLDTTYATAGSDGYETFDFSGTEVGWQMTLDQNGKAVLGGDTTNSTSTSDIIVIRLNTDGTADTGFDSDGTFRFSFTGGQDGLRGIEVDANNKVVVGGRGGNDFQVARLTTAGALDTTFDTDGKQSVNINGTDAGDALAIDASGRILIAGAVNGNTDFGVARLTSSGALDTSFDTDGKQTVDFAGGATVEECEAILVQSDGKVVLAGGSGNDFAVARMHGETTSGDVRHYAVQDANFNVTAVTDMSGVVVERYQYDPYGSFTVLDSNFAADADGQSDVAWAHLHQGGRYDANTGLYHFRNRDYSPSLGRWTTADPLGHADSMSVYQYLGQNPVARLDPMGLLVIAPISEPKIINLPPKPLSKQFEELLTDAQKECPSCADQAKELGDAIQSAVDSQNWQIGGYTGNVVSAVTGFLGSYNGVGGFNANWGDPGWGNQCGDWQDLISKTIAPLLQKYGDKSCFSGEIADGVGALGSTHNWVEIGTPKGSLVLDPWKTGGDQIVYPNTAEGFDNPSKTPIVPKPDWSKGQKCCP